MVWNEDKLKACAQRQYERGRLNRALRRALLLLPLVGLTLLLGQQPLQVLVSGAALLLGVIALLWRGMGWERAAFPGALAGGGVGLLAIAAERLDACCVGGEGLVCLAVCFVGGALAGGLVSAFALDAQPSLDAGRSRRSPDRAAVLGGGLSAALAASLGCAVGGMAGLLGMLAGLLIMTAPTFLFSGAAHRSS